MDSLTNKPIFQRPQILNPYLPRKGKSKLSPKRPMSSSQQEQLITNTGLVSHSLRASYNENGYTKPKP